MSEQHCFLATAGGEADLEFPDVDALARHLVAWRIGRLRFVGSVSRHGELLGGAVVTVWAGSGVVGYAFVPRQGSQRPRDTLRLAYEAVLVERVAA